VIDLPKAVKQEGRRRVDLDHCGFSSFGQDRSLEVLPRAVAATVIYGRYILDGHAVDLLAAKPRILWDEVWSADSSLRRSDPA
jgi:hypothetical protein